MFDMTDLDTLIRDLERETEGSRELDHDILAAVGCPTDWREDDDVQEYTFRTGFDWPPHYTTSLDSALTLVPEGWGWLVEVWQREESWAQIVRRPKGSTKPSGVFEGAEAKSPALALCIAALKARRREG